MKETEPAADEAHLAPERDEESEEYELPLEYKLPGLVVTGVIVVAWLFHLPSGMAMTDWAISAEILRDGVYRNVLLHMFAHAGLMHLLFNSSALVAFSPTVVVRLGAPPLAWLRFVVLFLLAGLAGMLAYLAVHPNGTVPMLGASGAIYGLIGFLVRFQGHDNAPSPLFSATTGKAVVQFIKDNLLLVVLLTLPALLAGSGGGVAWESHLGGFVIGLVVAPLFAARHPDREAGFVGQEPVE